MLSGTGRIGFAGTGEPSHEEPTLKAAVTSRRPFLLLAAGLLATSLAAPALAGQTHVAVAANFTEAAKEIADAFQRKTGHRAVLSFGSSGQLYAQITRAAPFQILLSADTERPRMAVEEGFAVAESRFTYAIGRLVLWSRDADLVKGEETLRAGSFAKLAIANPAAAPYGGAALETLTALGLGDALRPRIVQGNSIAQAFQFIDTGNAELGFIALSQLAGKEGGSRWLVPQTLHAPIRQDAVLLKTGASNEAATAFMAFLRGGEARAIIERYGYAVDMGS